MSNLIYDGPVKVYDKKTNGEPLIISKGDRQGEPYYKLSFKVGGEYVNLMDFEGLTDGASGTYHVEYWQKFNNKGEPELFNDKPQYQLEDLVPAGATQTAQSGVPTTNATPGSPAPQYGQDRNESIREQTSLKCAAEMYAAYLGANKGKMWDFEEFEGIYIGTKAVLDGKDELGVALEAAKQSLDAEPEAIPLPEAPLKSFDELDREANGDSIPY
jgi:hypothetical protein